MLALAPAVPERVTAGWNPCWRRSSPASTSAPARPYVDILLNACKGGGGGTEGADGYDHIGLITSGGAIAAQDPEMFEVVNPHLLQRFEYMPDSAGAGAVARRPRRRDRAGVPRRRRRCASSSATAARPRPRPSGSSAAARAPRTRSTSLPRRHGRPPAPEGPRHRRSRPAPSTARSPAAAAATAIRARAPRAVARDVRNGSSRRARARELYGVAIDTATWTIDEAETAGCAAGERSGDRRHLGGGAVLAAEAAQVA